MSDTGKGEFGEIPDEILVELGEAARRKGPAEALNLGPATTPRPAASVILLRRGGKHANRGLEVLLARRTTEASFMPGIWVFPGGGVEPEDGALDESGTAHRRCAARELQEETGVTLPDTEELVLFARWITPEAVKTRFDAWFFLALAPRHSPPRPDGQETIDAGWFTPHEALAAHEAGKLPLVFPTLAKLQMLTEFESSEQAIEVCRQRVVEPILPMPVETPEGTRLALPGDPNYPA